jgi:HSP20 family protein
MKEETSMQPTTSNECDASSGCGSNGHSAEHAQRLTTFRPNVDIVHGGDAVLIFADLPGAAPDAIEVRFDRSVLALTARVAARANSGATISKEYSVGDYQRSFRLPEDFDGSKTTAEYRDGVLCLRVPKAKEARSHKIEIKAGRG